MTKEEKTCRCVERICNTLDTLLLLSGLDKTAWMHNRNEGRVVARQGRNITNKEEGLRRRLPKRHAALWGK